MTCYLASIPMTAARAPLLYTREDACPHSCICSTKQVECDHFIPPIVPDTAREIVLSNVAHTELYPRRFCSVKWPRVVKFSIVSVRSLAYFNLSDYVFDCLDQLSEFKFRSEFLEFFANKTFSGLTNVTGVDISGCRSIYQIDLDETFAVQTNFPKLTHLNLSLTLIDDLLILDQDFIDALFLRPLVQLNVSDNNLEISFFNVSKLCSSLTHLLIHDTAAHYDEIFYDVEECSSLRIVDMSKELDLVNFFKDLNCVNSTVGIREFDFYGAVETMYINRCITSHLTAVNCSLEMYVNSSVKDLHFAQNHIPEFNFSLVNPNIKFVILSYNEIENIDSDALVGLPSLQKLDFSHNQIYKIKPLDTTVPNLFNRNLNLQVIDLSFNWLTYLPKRTFSANINLKQLHLNGNKLGQISFDISNLLNLTILDLRFNSIGFLDNFSRTTLTDLYKSQKQRNPNETGYIVQILLDGNPFSCSCQSLDFLRWFVASPIFSSPHRYSCELNGDVFALDKDAVKQSEEDCERPIRQRRIIVLSTTLPTIAVAVMVITALYVFKRRKRKFVDQRYADKVRLLREDNIGFVYPVFLSYSSVDHDFVVPNILRPLEVKFKIKEMLFAVLDMTATFKESPA